MTVTIKNGKRNRAELELELEIDMLNAFVADLEQILRGVYPDERELNKFIDDYSLEGECRTRELP